MKGMFLGFIAAMFFVLFTALPTLAVDTSINVQCPDSTDLHQTPA